jgi:two-component system, NtrC family, nitrogen regulation sensor histidine kinase NtrY
MKLRTKYLLFVIIVHSITLVLSFIIFRNDKPLFIFSELFILLSVWISWQLYRDLIRPLNMLKTGVDAIRERDFNIKFLETGKYEMDQLINVYNQMIDQLRHERTQQEQQHFFLEKLIQTSPTGIIILDYDSNIHQVNPKAIQLLKLEEIVVIGKSLQAFQNPVLDEVSKLESGRSKTVTLNGAETYKIQKSHFIDRGFARYFVLIEELTIEILAAEKKAYGKVIRMMAHEVNNTIGPVNSILQSALQLQQQDGAIGNALQVALDRNNNLNQFMRNFADVVRLPLPNKKITDLHHLLQGVLQLMEFKAGEKQVRFEWSDHTIPFSISADAQQMEQVFINIIKNALEAIEEKGTISIILQHQPRQLIIRDTGKGIDPAIADQLFSPFFSTKREGQGLGLTIIREILINHGFSFSLKTYPEGITEFQINF